MKFAIVAIALAFGIAGAHAQERDYRATVHNLTSHLNLGDHPEVSPILEQMLDGVPSSAHGYINHMIKHAPRGPGDPFYDYWSN